MHAAKKNIKIKKNNIRFVDLDPHSFELLDPDKYRKSKEFSCFEVLDVLF